MDENINFAALAALSLLLLLAVGYGWLEFTKSSRNPGLEGGSSEVLRSATTQARPSFQSGEIYFIDNTVSPGVDGCNLAFVSSERGPYFTSNLLRSVVVEQVGLETDEPLPGSYNALHESDLTFLASRVVDGVVAVELRGWLRVSDACQQAQALGQLERTISRTAGTDEIEIFLNQRPLQQSLRFEQRY